jgi:hypothetical protein
MVIDVQGGIHLEREVIVIPVGYLVHARGGFVTGETIFVCCWINLRPRRYGQPIVNWLVERGGCSNEGSTCRGFIVVLIEMEGYTDNTRAVGVTSSFQLRYRVLIHHPVRADISARDSCLCFFHSASHFISLPSFCLAHDQ